MKNEIKFIQKGNEICLSINGENSYIMSFQDKTEVEALVTRVNETLKLKMSKDQSKELLWAKQCLKSSPPFSKNMAS